MNKAGGVILSVALSVLMSWFLFAHYGKLTPATASKETAYERVLRTGEIRCAYAPYEPAFMKDPNTGQFSGIFYDIMTEVGKRLNLKINWVEEVGYGVIPAGFVSDRYDAFCSVVFPTAERAHGGSFTIPLFYSAVDVFVRADDHRFDNDLSKLDDPAILFAGRDGDISSAYAKAAFPNAKLDGIAQLVDTSQTLDDVVHKKADATINEPGLLALYLEKNPGALVNITSERHIRVTPNTMMIKPDQYQFKTMLDVTLQELLNDGSIEKILRKYDKYNVYLRVANPYQMPASQQKQ